MYHYWRNNKNVILVAVAMFTVSLTALLSFLSGEPGGHNPELSANVVDSISVKAQQETESSYRSLLEDHEGPLVVLGVDGLVQFSSWDFESSTGYGMADVEDQLFYSFIHPEDLSTFIGAFGKVLASESPVMMIGPYRMRNVEGQYQVHMASFYPLKEDDKVVKVMIAIRDITGELSDGEEEAPESEKSPNEEHQEEVKDDNGHGNDADGCDESNPAGCKSKKSPDKRIRDTKNNEEKKLIVEKLAMVFTLNPFHERSLPLQLLALRK